MMSASPAIGDVPVRRPLRRLWGGFGQAPTRAAAAAASPRQPFTAGARFGLGGPP